MFDIVIYLNKMEIILLEAAGIKKFPPASVIVSLPSLSLLGTETFATG